MSCCVSVDIDTQTASTYHVLNQQYCVEKRVLTFVAVHPLRLVANVVSSQVALFGAGQDAGRQAQENLVHGQPILMNSFKRTQKISLHLLNQ